MSILNSIPAWFLWSLLVAIVLMVYHYLFDDNLKSSIKKFFVTNWFWIALIFVFIWGRNSWGFWIATDSIFHFSRVSDTFLVIGLLFGGLLKQWLGKLRYLSTQAIADNRSGSCAQYSEVGDYVVLNIGSVDADMFPWYSGHETWVVPKRHFSKINGSVNKTKAEIVIKTFIDKNELTEIPSNIQDFIESSKGYNKENIYYGEFSREEYEILSGKQILDEKGQKLSLTEYEMKLKDTQRMLNEARAMIKGKTKSILGYISNTNEIMKKAKGTENRNYSQNPETGY